MHLWICMHLCELVWILKADLQIYEFIWIEMILLFAFVWIYVKLLYKFV
jgi:hypothetical protein